MRKIIIGGATLAMAGSIVFGGAAMAETPSHPASAQSSRGDLINPVGEGITLSPPDHSILGAMQDLVRFFQAGSTNGFSSG